MKSIQKNIFLIIFILLFQCVAHASIPNDILEKSISLSVPTPEASDFFNVEVICIDPQGNTTTFEYDLTDRMIKETRPMGQVIEYAYYPNGLLKTVKDGKGQVTTYSYDVANRLKEIIYADNKKDTFTYDAAGNMLTYTKDGVSGSITYDNLNRKLSETVNYSTFSKTYSYTYDALSNKASFTSPEGKTYTYTYNKNNQPTSIAFDSKIITLDYQVDRLTKAVLPNGVTTYYQYNANSWLNYITAKNASSTQLDKQYEFDKVGNITRKTDNATSITDYNYDTTYQLTKATNPSLTEEFTYDKVGNRLTSSSLRAESEAISSYTHNANNELSQSCIVNPASCIVYAYDQNGNTTQETNGSQITKFIYNSSDRLEKVELPDGRIAIYTYDPFGRRIKKDVAGNVTYYLYADEGLIGEYDASGNLLKAYGWVPDSIWGTNPVYMLENNNYYFYHNDHLGTPQKMTDINGNVVWSATYTAFGEAIVDASSTVVNNLRFPGQYYDSETGLHYNWNRYYDPKRGRYTQVDPIGFSAGDENLYRYAKNKVIDHFDPKGKFVLQAAEVFIIAGGITLVTVVYIESPAGKQALQSIYDDIKDYLDRMKENKPVILVPSEKPDPSRYKKRGPLCELILSQRIANCEKKYCGRPFMKAGCKALSMIEYAICKTKPGDSDD